MTLTKMRHLLEDRGIQLTKSLGQNFLHDQHQLERIAATAELTATDKVIEIGPGLGPLTERLLQRAGEVLAVEKDERLVKVLEERFNVTQASGLPPDSTVRAKAGAPTLQLLHADALGLLKQDQRDWSEWKLVSNLPYAVASPILVELCRSACSPQRMVATLQLEVAHRLMSEPGTKDYGMLTLLVQLDFQPVRWFKIPAGCFFPRPDVDSACILLKRRPTRLLPDALRPAYVRIVKRAFSQRRKMMMKLLRQDWDGRMLDQAYQQTNLSPQVRAEAVSLGQFIALAERLGSPGA